MVEQGKVSYFLEAYAVGEPGTKAVILLQKLPELPMYNPLPLPPPGGHRIKRIFYLHQHTQREYIAI